MIGDEPEEALLCLTDFYGFFNDTSTLRTVGQWYFPDESEVDSNDDIYEQKSRSGMLT